MIAPVETSVAPNVLLVNHLRALKLPTFAREYEKTVLEAARENVDYPRYLLRLCELERIDRERRNMERRIRLARFPQIKDNEARKIVLKAPFKVQKTNLTVS